VGALTSQQKTLFRYGVNILKPKPILTGSEWADDRYFLSPESSAIVGKWKTYPWQKEILDAMTDQTTQIVVVKKPTRIGYSLMLGAVFGYYVEQRPSNQLHYQPNADEAKGYAEDTIEPLIRDNPCILKLVETPNTRGRVKKEKTVKKLYPGGYAEFLGAESARNFNRRTARLMTIDEADALKKEAGNTGDVVSTALRRTSDFVDRKNIIGGKPVGAEYVKEDSDSVSDGVSIVDYWFKQGTQEYRYFPCPKCNHLQRFEFEDMIWDKDKDENEKTIKHHPETVHFACKECSFKIFDKHKRDMDKKGKWIAHNPEAIKNKIRSFHPWAMISYSPNVTWEDIVKEFLSAKNNRLKLKAFTNEVLARTWEEDYEKSDTSMMMDRREEYPAQIPDPVLILTMGADVQKDRIECEVIGWCKNYESYAIEYKKFFGDTTQPEVWEQFREYILAKRWYREDGKTMSIYTGCIDAGYLTNIVTQFCKPLFVKRIFATQGATTINAKVNPGVIGRTKKDKNKIFTVGVNKAKDEIAWHIASDIGAGFMHFPKAPEYNEEYFKQLGAEKKDKKGRWIATRARNEVIDVRVYNYISLFLASIDLELLSHRGAVTDSSLIVKASKRKILSKGIRK